MSYIFLHSIKHRSLTGNCLRSTPCVFVLSFNQLDWPHQIHLQKEMRSHNLKRDIFDQCWVHFFLVLRFILVALCSTATGFSGTSRIEAVERQGAGDEILDLFAVAIVSGEGLRDFL